MINQGDTIVPDKKLVVVPEKWEYESSPLDIVVPLKGQIKREGVLPDHAYQCLPLVIGNQYGFAIKSVHDWEAVWDGGESLSATKVTVNQTSSEQFVSSHFGNGIVTIQNRFTFRTPPGVNLVTINPPNIPTDNFFNLFGVIETDNLRRDFTFNLKIVNPGVPVKVKAGQIISAVLPYPRYFVDDYQLTLASSIFTKDVIEEEMAEMQHAGRQREEEDSYKPRGVGKRYWRGEDTQGNKFKDHQRRL